MSSTNTIDEPNIQPSRRGVYMSWGMAAGACVVGFLFGSGLLAFSFLIGGIYTGIKAFQSYQVERAELSKALQKAKSASEPVYEKEPQRSQEVCVPAPEPEKMTPAPTPTPGTNVGAKWQQEMAAEAAKAATRTTGATRC